MAVQVAASLSGILVVLVVFEFDAAGALLFEFLWHDIMYGMG